MSSTVTIINVGGQLFTTTESTLCDSSYLKSLIHLPDNIPVDRDRDGHLFIDRCPRSFNNILRLLRRQKVVMDSLQLFERIDLREDIEFYGIDENLVDLGCINPAYVKIKVRSKEFMLPEPFILKLNLFRLWSDYHGCIFVEQDPDIFSLLFRLVSKQIFMPAVRERERMAMTKMALSFGYLCPELKIDPNNFTIESAKLTLPHGGRNTLQLKGTLLGCSVWSIHFVAPNYPSWEDCTVCVKLGFLSATDYEAKELGHIMDDLHALTSRKVLNEIPPERFTNIVHAIFDRRAEDEASSVGNRSSL